MKNKFIYFSLALILFSLKSIVSFAENEFVFESSSIEIKDNGNIINAKWSANKFK